MVAAARIRERAADADRLSLALIGQPLSHYDIIDRLGSGGMGDVYLAKDRALGRSVAVKILPQELADDPRRLERFRLEARAASALAHPNVAAIYELGEAGGVPFIAMEHVEGRTLDALLRDGPMTFETVLDVALQFTAALAAAHRGRDYPPRHQAGQRDGDTAGRRRRCWTLAWRSWGRTVWLRRVMVTARPRRTR